MTATFSGVVFDDVNNNGTMDGAEVGIAGVTVSAYDDAGLDTSIVSGPGGVYQLDVSNTGPWRIELSDIPSGYYSSSSALTINSSVRFHRPAKR